MSPEMNAAVTAFKNKCPSGLSVRPQTNPLYTLITVDGWPGKVHYEFRDNAESRELYVELHIEDSQYEGIKETLKAIVAKVVKSTGSKSTISSRAAGLIARRVHRQALRCPKTHMEG
jgi:hypothetical protein